MYAIKAHWRQYVSNVHKLSGGMKTDLIFYFTHHEDKAMKFPTKESTQAQLDKWESWDIDIVGDFSVVLLKRIFE